MMKILLFMLASILIKVAVIGEPYWNMIMSLGEWVLGRVDSTEIFGFYDEVSLLQISVISICEIIALIFILSKGEVNKEMDEEKDNEFNNEEYVE